MLSPLVVSLRVRSLCACIALACAPLAAATAQTANDGQRVPLLDATGAPQQVQLAEWHAASARLPATSAGRPATTLAVTDCGDGTDSGTLRNTIAGAADGDIIDLRALACSSITLTDGVIPIPVENLSLLGPGADALAIDGNANDRVFIHPYNGTFTIESLTVRNGRDRASGFDLAGGGCIAEASYLALSNSVVSGCYAGGEGAYGGAIYAYGLQMNNSTLAGNTAYGIHENAGTAAFGGAAFVYQLKMSDSIVSGNTAGHHEAGRPSYDIGGGIITIRASNVASSTIERNYATGRGGGLASFSQDGMSIVNSTISGNRTVTAGGGGIFIRPLAYLSLVNSTVTLNHANEGGGLFAGPAVAPTLSSNLVFGNTATVAASADLASSGNLVIAGSHNLVGAAGLGVLLPADTLQADPHLLPLANNGGATPTHAIARGSPAIDAGTNSAASVFDQRGTGYPRVYGPAPDIGSYEVQAIAAREEVAVPTLSAWMLGLLVAGLALLVRRRSDIGCKTV